jgi:hypothetical protein
MKKLWYIVPLVILALVVGMTGCTSGNGGQSTPTPSATANVTASPTPVSTSNASATTHPTLVMRGMPTSTPTSAVRIILPKKADTISLSTLARNISVTQNLSGYKLLQTIQAVPRVVSVKLPPADDDSQDLAAMVVSLTPAELNEFGIQLATQTIAQLTPSFPASAPKPYYNIGVQVILCANDDGSGGAAGAYAMTPDYFTKIIAAANVIYANAGIRLVYNPATDFEKRNSSLLNLDFTIPSNINYWSPASAPPISDAQMATLNKSHNDERQNVGNEYRGKLVLMLCDGDMLVYDSLASRWKIIDRTYAFSWADMSYVALPTGEGDVQSWANLLAHETGHYFHQWHPQVEATLSDAQSNDPSLTDYGKAKILKDEIASWIKYYVVQQGHSEADGRQVLDADLAQVNDTPPDPGHWVFAYANGDECGNVSTVTVQVQFDDGTMTYTIQPDRADVMSYFKHCVNIPMHFTADQIAGIRKSIEQQNRRNLVNPAMRLTALDTHVVDDQVYYNAVWQPGTSNDAAVFGWARSDFLSETDYMWNNGWRTKLLNSYVVDGQVVYDAVWQPGTSNDRAVYGWTFTDFSKEAGNQYYNASRRMKCLDTYVVDNQVYYNAVWEPGTDNEVTVLGYARNDFLKEDNDMRNGSFHLKLLNSYVVNGQVVYDAVWEPGAPNDVCVYGWAYDDFVAKANAMHSSGWGIVLLDSYVLNGQILYNAVWHPATSEHWALGYTFADFNTEYNDVW